MLIGEIFNVPKEPTEVQHSPAMMVNSCYPGEKGKALTYDVLIWDTFFMARS